MNCYEECAGEEALILCSGCSYVKHQEIGGYSGFCQYNENHIISHICCTTVSLYMKLYDLMYVKA